MPNNGFFGLVWRFNAIVIALAASGAIIALLTVFIGIGMSFVRERTWRDETGLVERDASQPESVTYSLANAEQAEGTNIVIHALNRTRREPRAIPIKSSYSYDSDVVNLLIVDDVTTKGSWMFGGAGQTLYARSFIYDPATLSATKGERRASAMLIHLSDSDTNKDGAVDARDESALMAYKLADGSRRTLVNGPLSLISMRQAEDGRVLVMYEVGEKTILTSFDANDFRLLATSELPRLSTAPSGAAAPK